MTTQALFWIFFNVFVVFMLALDLGVFHKKAHTVHIKESLAWSSIWIILALLFNLCILFWKGHTAALQFLTGYLIEISLSVDNLFVFLLIFSYFSVPPQYQHKALFWGIIGAIVMRITFIFAGIKLIEKFHWIIYVFGLFLVVSGIKLALEKDKEVHPERNPALRLFRRFMPILKHYREERFFVKRSGRYFATPLFVVLLAIETTDIMFALDSIPAILAITTDPFIVYTSNVFAIMGLRSLYFALAGLMRLFHYLHYGLSIVLVFIGLKMLLSNFYKFPIELTLAIVAGILSISILASIITTKPNTQAPQTNPGSITPDKKTKSKVC